MVGTRVGGHARRQLDAGGMKCRDSVETVLYINWRNTRRVSKDRMPASFYKSADTMSIRSWVLADYIGPQFDRRIWE